MTEKVRFISLKLIGYLVLLGGVFLLTTAFFTLFHNAKNVPSVLSSGDPQITLQRAEDGKGFQVTDLATESPAYAAGLRAHDVVTAINSISITDKVLRDFEFRGMVPVTLTVMRDTAILSITFAPRYLPFRSRVLTLFIMLLIPTIFLLYVFVGLYGLANSPFTRITILIALVCFSIGGLVFIPFRNAMNVPESFLEIYKTGVECIRMFVYLTPSLWLFLFLNFPEKNTYYKTHKWITLFLTFIVPATIIYISFYRFNLSDNFSNRLIFQFIFFTILLLFISIGVRLLHAGKLSNTTILRRRQFRLTLFGLTFGAISLGIGFIGLLIWIPFQEQFMTYSLWVYLFFVTAQCGSLIIPLTFLNSFYHNQLLETETILKKRLLYSVITLAILGAYTTGLILLTGSMLRAGGVQDYTIIVALILVTAATFWPINNFIHKKLERAIFPDRTLFKELFREFSRSFPLYNDYEMLSESVRAWFRSVMNISTIHIHSFDIEHEKMVIKPEDNASVVHVCSNGLVFYWDEVGENNAVTVNSEEYLWAKEHKIALSLPIIVRKELTGIMNIGIKTNNDDFTGHELEIFRSAAENLGVALQTLQLRREYAEKQRLDRELEVARDIQMRLLPTVMPKIPGLILHGASKPCNEVGGDYYDAIVIDDHRALLAIGDVSGKGVGAAMLMANLQASLKIAVRFNRSLKEITQELNSLIYENTGPSEFITFFCGLWDSKKATIEFVNAGHNPPVLIRDDGATDFLYPTGIALGLLGDSTYTTDSVMMHHNDLLFLYTDGIEEAFAPTHEQFGIAKIIESLRHQKTKEPCAIAHALLGEVEAFSHGIKPYDDMTLIVAKRNEVNV